MTYSLLVRDPDTGALGGAAATGALCVGGWVLRGRTGCGLSASQGAAPSTLWGEAVLERMAGGDGAAAAVAEVTGADPGRAQRQLSALDAGGSTGAHSGTGNTPELGHLALPGGIAAGNMLASTEVLEALVAGFMGAPGSLPGRLVAALKAAERAGGDARGLQSAALLVLHPEAPPLTLRIDHHPSDPLGALDDLLGRATSGDYADWARQVPTLADPHRILRDQ